MSSAVERIWFVQPDAAALNALHEGTAVSNLGIEITEVGENYLCGRMPVDARTKQPFGLMHGGAAVLLLETLASAAANHCVDPEHFMCVGMEVNCNHLRGVRGGHVEGRATAVLITRTSMVWQLDAFDDRGRQVSSGRLTSAVVDKPG
jgi:1,4-dihydroxy-2-naphthoyl-CoA hydrolase